MGGGQSWTLTLFLEIGYLAANTANSGGGGELKKNLYEKDSSKNWDLKS